MATSYEICTSLGSWQVLNNYINEWFHRPDLEALRIAFAVSLAHRTTSDPVWLFVIGPAASGKTSIVINCLWSLTDAHLCGDLTPKTLLSASRGSNVSLLERVGTHPLLLFKDFTTILSKRDDDQKEIISQFRELWDGLVIKDTGRIRKEWRGKATIIAACTPAVERAWGFHRDMGERFVQVRWPNGNPQRISERARAQIGHEEEIAHNMRELSKRFFDSASNELPELSIEQGTRIDNLASISALLRTQVIRESSNKRSIMDIGCTEEPGRITKACSLIAKSHAALFNREINDQDMKASKRIAIDSIPANRLRVIDCIPTDAEISVNDIVSLTDMLLRTVHWVADELEALQIITIARARTGNMLRFRQTFAENWKLCN